MKINKFFIVSILLLIYSSLQAQTINLSFSGKSGNVNVPLDSIYIENLTQGGDTLLYSGDTVFSIVAVGIADKQNTFETTEWRLESFPNPFKGNTNIYLYIPESSKVTLIINNTTGQELATFSQLLKKGTHHFSYSSGKEKMTFLNAIYKNHRKARRLISITSDNAKQLSIDYRGIISETEIELLKSSKGLPFNIGDQLLFVGYAYLSSDTIIDAPITSQNYQFQFLFGLPCPGVPSVIYDGQTYSTVQIGTQCWMAENLNVGYWIDANVDPHDNGFIEKNCYGNIPSNCDNYGGLYRWDELMNYKIGSGEKGICMTGWHVPSDEEWKILEGTVDSLYSIGDPVWDQSGWRGYDSGKSLKSISGWDNNGNGSDFFGFNALSSGFAFLSNFNNLGKTAMFASSTEQSTTKAWSRAMNYDSDNISRNNQSKGYAVSIRCLKDSCLYAPTTPDAGADSFYIPNDSIVLMGNTPVHGHGTWSILSGNGGSFTDINDPTTAFYGMPDSAYVLEWRITTACTYLIDEVNISFGSSGAQPCPGLASFIYGGQAYTTVLIGTQCWMAENLNIGIPIYGLLEQTDNGVIEKYCYDDNTLNCDTFGGLYTWDEMMQYKMDGYLQGICPYGWHIPTDSAWSVLIDYLGGNLVAGSKMKEAGFNHWQSPNTGATNSSAFTALPGGYNSQFDTWDGIFTVNMLWSSSLDTTWSANMVYLSYDSETAVDSVVPKVFGLSVRCLRDTCIQYPTTADAGPDTLGIPVDTIVLAANVPSYGQGEWIVLSGGGGSFSDINDPFATFYGQYDTIYTLRWKIYTACTKSTDEVVIGFAPPAPQPCPGLPSFVYGGQTYNTIFVGGQCWMAENLNIGLRKDGYLDQKNNGMKEKYCYNDMDLWCGYYGGLYQWGEAMQYSTKPGAQGICPAGWHIPKTSEADQLLNYLGGANVAGGKLKETGTSHWSSPNTGATNESGFTALPSGIRGEPSGSFSNIGTDFYLWTISDGSSAYTYRLENVTTIFFKTNYFGQDYGLSVRCLKDCEPKPDQADAGPDTLNVQGDSIALMGNIPVVGQGVWTIYSGKGGHFADSSDGATIFYGLQGMQYNLIWTISNYCNTFKDTVRVSFAGPWFPPCPGIPTVSYGGKIYNTMQIDTTCWMRENLNIGTFITDSSYQQDNGIIEKYCYGNDTANCEIYGGLYQWHELMQYENIESSRGICPQGWHVPSDEEWVYLEGHIDTKYFYNDLEWYQTNEYRGYDVGYNMKSDTGWNNDGNGNASSGFSELPGGQYSFFYSGFGYLGQLSIYWTSTVFDAYAAWSRDLGYPKPNMYRGYDDFPCGNYVKCIRDCLPQPTQADAGNDTTGIVGDSIALSANTPVIGQGTWSIIYGYNGKIAETNNPNSLFYGLPGQTYMLVWTITNVCNVTEDTVMLHFATRPCPGLLSFTYGGQTYNTIQIGINCWMKENLNIGTMIPCSTYMTDNGVVEKYCYDDDSANCDIYGGLYYFNEMMDYSSALGAQGICPAGWHIPTDDEWKDLEGSTDSMYRVGSGEWNKSFDRGYDVGKNLKATTSWNVGGNGTDASGFSALAAGYMKYYDLDYYDIGSRAYFWTSHKTYYSDHIARMLYDTNSYSYRNTIYERFGLSVRCTKGCTPLPTVADAGYDMLNLTGNNTQLNGNTPVNSQGVWSITSGYGGSFNDSTNPTTLFYGIPGVTYTLVWTISNYCGSTSDDMMLSFAPFTFVCGNPFFDIRDGQFYNTVQIGSQCWMSENLNVGSMIGGGSNQTDNLIIEKYCYSNDTNNCHSCGGLYQWLEATQYGTMGQQGICPAGWHIPSDDEWKLLEGTVDSQYGVGSNIWNHTGYRGTDAGRNLKTTTGWAYAGNGNNSFGFSVKPCGDRQTDGLFYAKGSISNFWTRTAPSSAVYWNRMFHSYADGIHRDDYNSYRGFSIRCLRD